MSRWAVCLLMIAVGLSVTGCLQPYVNDERLDRGLVIVLSGIEGRSMQTLAICEGLDRGGVDSAIEIFDWAAWVSPLESLQDRSRNRRQAGLVAARISEYQDTYPGRPTYVVGQSGGGGLAVWVAESMPRGRQLDGVILLAPAISPEYPLLAALLATHRGIVNFYSQGDWVVLGLGTSMYGTIDGKMTNSAGMMGFSRAATAGLRSRGPKLIQVAWSEEMIGEGHLGGHMTSGSMAFVRRYVAPFIAGDGDAWESSSADPPGRDARDARE
ncbi:hypothetical protein LCGC14_0276670 [marine sediment metagenome]|uniref:Serine aminopeptidase S33 domain-containing protein n=1 Tax=marine sediment metagenome TaxID=412755 RepID=A0A0F9X2J1_9ZZZZ|nr:hypothetical protein [Phycisphaerae bacterium]HDZ42669.1 hypothetical protein [Phycisphaerae bacterium]